MCEMCVEEGIMWSVDFRDKENETVLSGEIVKCELSSEEMNVRLYSSLQNSCVSFCPEHWCTETYEHILLDLNYMFKWKACEGFIQTTWKTILQMQGVMVFSDKLLLS